MPFSEQKNIRNVIEVEGTQVSVRAKTGPCFKSYQEAFKKAVHEGIELTLRGLKLRPKTVFEAKTALGSKGFLEVEIDEILARLKAEKYLDDRLYLRYFLASYQQHKPFGEYALKQKLTAKGIARDLLEEELSAYQAENDPALEAYELILKRWGRYEGLPKYKQIQKIDRYLFGRGFEYEVTEKVISRLGKEGYLSGK